MEFILAYITIKDRSEALALGRRLLEENLAACINILPQMESLYWWKGQMETAEEAVLIAKTSKENGERLTQFVIQNHPYECPCVLWLEVVGGNPDYLRWLGSVQNPKESKA